MNENTNLVFPEGNFTVADLIAANTTMSTPTIYSEVRNALKSNKIQVAGKAPKTGKGRKSTVYKTA